MQMIDHKHPCKTYIIGNFNVPAGTSHDGRAGGRRPLCLGKYNSQLVASCVFPYNQEHHRTGRCCAMLGTMQVAVQQVCCLSAAFHIIFEAPELQEPSRSNSRTFVLANTDLEGPELQVRSVVQAIHIENISLEALTLQKPWGNTPLTRLRSKTRVWRGQNSSSLRGSRPKTLNPLNPNP